MALSFELRAASYWVKLEARGSRLAALQQNRRLLDRFFEKTGGHGCFNFALGLNDTRRDEEDQLLIGCCHRATFEQVAEVRNIPE